MGIGPAERLDRANRWGYYGLHGLDFALLCRYRPLWDIAAIVLLIGVGVSSVTSIVPAFRRLARHTRVLAPSARHSVQHHRDRGHLRILSE